MGDERKKGFNIVSNYIPISRGFLDHKLHISFDYLQQCNVSFFFNPKNYQGIATDCEETSII